MRTACTYAAHTVHHIRTVYDAAPYTVWRHILCMHSTVAGSRRTIFALCMARHHMLSAQVRHEPAAVLCIHSIWRRDLAAVLRIYST
jgi:hypothetical protein